MVTMALFRIKLFRIRFLLFLVYMLHSAAIRSSAYCPSPAANYTANSTFHTNLNHLLASLNASAALNHFANDTEGEGTDRVFGLALCLIDNPTGHCQACITQATKEIVEQCPNKKTSAVWPSSIGNCVLRYSDDNFFTSADTSYSISYHSADNATEPERFIKALGELLRYVNDKAAFRSNRLMYATAEANWTSFTKLYSQVWCTRDLLGDECLRCLTVYTATLPSGDSIPRSGGIFGLSCGLRYDIYPFYTLKAGSPPLMTPNRTIPPPQSSDVAPDNGRPPAEKKSNTSKLVLGITLSLVAASIFLMFTCICLKRRRATKQTQDIDGYQQELGSAESLLLDIGLLRAATNNFSDELKLGEGGFGPVYKGKLLDGREIAVKRLSRHSGQGLQELKNEVILVARLQHKNLVRLLGCCLQEQEKLLIYEYLPNLSLDKFLFDPAASMLIDWGKRYKIIEGIARGLLYLHEDSRLKIVHRDLKASNILLDSDMLPKISDFGLAKLFDTDQSQASTSRIAGTYGYMAPEYVINRICSTKLDVFSYGVLVLEIVSGRKNSDFRGSGNSMDLLSHAWKHWNGHTALQIVDQSLGQQYQSHQVLRCMHIGLLCVQEDEELRPNMSTVVLMLNSKSFTLSSPSVPAFFPRTGMMQNSGSKIHSANEVSISDMEGR